MNLRDIQPGILNPWTERRESKNVYPLWHPLGSHLERQSHEARFPNKNNFHRIFLLVHYFVSSVLYLHLGTSNLFRNCKCEFSRELILSPEVFGTEKKSIPSKGVSRGRPSVLIQMIPENVMLWPDQFIKK